MGGTDKEQVQLPTLRTQSLALPSLCREGLQGSPQKCRDEMGEAMGHITSMRACSRLEDEFKWHSQVKYQVVVALFRDAVMEPHCSRDRGLRAAWGAWVPFGIAGISAGSSSSPLPLFPLPLTGSSPTQPRASMSHSSEVTSKLGTSKLAEIPAQVRIVPGCQPSPD